MREAQPSLRHCILSSVWWGGVRESSASPLHSVKYSLLTNVSEVSYFRAAREL